MKKIDIAEVERAADAVPAADGSVLRLRASRRSRWGTTTYLGSFVDSTPASNTRNRCSALPASSASPDAAAPARLRPAEQHRAEQPGDVQHLGARPSRAAWPCS